MIWVRFKLFHVSLYFCDNNCKELDLFSIQFQDGSDIKGVLHPRALFLKILCIFSKNKATSD